MKTKIFIYCSLLIFVSYQAHAQSDYEMLITFKGEYQKIQTSIKNVTSNEDLELVKEKILNLKNEYASNRLLLDKALYPENFQSSFDKIETAYEDKRKDLSQITMLSTQVGSLQSQVNELNTKNEELINQIKLLKIKSEKDQSKIAELEQLISQLKGNINQRDRLVRDLVDSLLVALIKLPEKINQREANTIIAKIKKGNLFTNIDRAIQDNIQFLKVTKMNSDDFSKIFKQYHDFNKVWKQIGPRLSTVYLTKRQNKWEIEQIDSLFIVWNSQIQSSVWENIHNLFMEYNFKLPSFNDANSFVHSINGFVDNEIAEIDHKSKVESEERYSTFSDSLYFKRIESKWIPLLIENHMMAQNEKQNIDEKIKLWQKELVQLIPTWAYIAVGVLLLMLAVFIYQKRQTTFKRTK